MIIKDNNVPVSDACDKSTKGANNVNSKCSLKQVNKN